jgi:hypothetical protein
LVIEAEQWFKNGDHSLDECETFIDNDGKSFRGEGHVVRYFRSPNLPGSQVHGACGFTLHEHGWIDTLEGGHDVCPGDWIIKGIKGEFYPCKPDIFAASYEAEP